MLTSIVDAQLETRTFLRSRVIEPAPKMAPPWLILFFSEPAGLIAGAMKDVEDIQDSSRFPVVDQVFSRGKASYPTAEPVASPPDPRHFAKQCKLILDSFDQAIRDLQAGAPGPIFEDFVKVTQCAARNAQPDHRPGASCSRLRPLALISAVSRASPSLPSHSV